MITKETILKTLKGMPDNIKLDEFLYKVVLLQKIETGIQQSKKNKTISTGALKRKYALD